MSDRTSLKLKISLFLWVPIATCLSAFAQTATTTSLTLTSGGNSVTSINVGTMIILTASVSTGSTVIKQGQVNFCDATVTYCTDIHLLGTAQLTSSGHAQLHLRPATGSYSYKAVFLGTPKTTIPYTASASTADNLTVTGKVATATTIAQSGPSSDYTLTASVLGFTNSQALPPPSGTVSFVDISTNNSVLGMATLAPATGPAWVNASNPAVGGVDVGVPSRPFVARMIRLRMNLRGNRLQHHHDAVTPDHRPEILRDPVASALVLNFKPELRLIEV